MKKSILTGLGILFAVFFIPIATLIGLDYIYLILHTPKDSFNLKDDQELYIRYVPTTQEMREEYIIDSNGDTAWAVYTIKVQKHYSKTKQVY